MSVPRSERFPGDATERPIFRSVRFVESGLRESALQGKVSSYRALLKESKLSGNWRDHWRDLPYEQFLTEPSFKVFYDGLNGPSRLDLYWQVYQDIRSSIKRGTGS